MLKPDYNAYIREVISEPKVEWAGFFKTRTIPGVRTAEFYVGSRHIGTIMDDEYQQLLVTMKKMPALISFYSLPGERKVPTGGGIEMSSIRHLRR